ncbi:hypothetical protein [Delftia acidovorans]|uniref:hypothetical protein n=1 Tax=Delftia acidovorans TaxID=80866 RepID=UPI003D09AC87
MPLAQVQSLWSKVQQARDKALGNPFVQQALHEARNDDKVWNTKVLPLQRKLQSRLKGVVPQEAPPKALQSQALHVHTDPPGHPPGTEQRRIWPYRLGRQLQSLGRYSQH